MWRSSAVSLNISCLCNDPEKGCFLILSRALFLFTKTEISPLLLPADTCHFANITWLHLTLLQLLKLGAACTWLYGVWPQHHSLYNCTYPVLSPWRCVRTVCWGECFSERESKRRQVLHVSYCLPNIMNIIKSRRRRLVEYIAHIGKNRTHILFFSLKPWSEKTTWEAEYGW
jgi:hypothetical protein